MKTKRPFFILLFGIIIIFLFNISDSNCQPFWEWDVKMPLTDSISENMNHDLLYLFSNSHQDMVSMVWENSIDSTSTAIFYMNLLDPGEPAIVISDAGIHYTHPKILKVESPEYIFYVFYQSDQDENQDIYYMKYGLDGQFTGPFEFATSEFNEINFEAGNDSYWGKSSANRSVLNVLTWTNNGDLMTCSLEDNGDVFSFSEPEILDTADCSNPVILSDNIIYYIRRDEAGSFIYQVFKDNLPGNWGEPHLYFNEGNCFNLAEDNIAQWYIAWSADSNGVYRNYIATSGSSFDGYAVGPGQETPFDPAVCDIIIAIKADPKQFYDYYMAFPYLVNEYHEIFMNEGYNWGEPEFFNFSQSNTENRNPELYLGETDPWNFNCFYVYLVWEEFRNGHWQIFDSKTIMCIGSVDENNVEESFIKTYPNPFSSRLNISYTLPAADYVKIEICDLIGRSILEIFNGKQFAGDQQMQWDGRDNAGNEVPSGLYFVRVKNETGCYFARIIKSN